MLFSTQRLEGFQFGTTTKHTHEVERLERLMKETQKVGYIRI